MYHQLMSDLNPNHRDLVTNLTQTKRTNSVFGKIIKPNSRVAKVMMMVDRGDFCSEENKINCYNDSPSSIGYNQTISAPHMHAMALNYLTENGHIKKGSKVLDVGCGSGYLTAAFAYLAEVNEKDGGLVVGIDILPDLVKLSEDNIRKHNKDLLESGQIILLTQDGWKGYPLESYDAIHVGATAESFPKELWNQLKPGGRIFIPIEQENGNHKLMIYDKPKYCDKGEGSEGAEDAKDAKNSENCSLEILEQKCKEEISKKGQQGQLGQSDSECFKKPIIDVRYVPLIKKEETEQSE